MVPPGFRFAAASVTNCPVAAERFTAVVFEVPVPTRSVVVLLGQRAAAAAETKRPDPALLFTVLPMRASLKERALSCAVLVVTCVASWSSR
jgi:hypothetical protein